MNPKDATVFIVEDDDDMRRSLERMITSVGHAVEAYASPADFLAGFDSEAHGCLILDLRLPKISGLELFELLRSRGDDLPVIFVSGHAEVEVVTEAMREAAWDFLEKPFSRNRLLDRMNQAIDFDAAARSRLAERKEIEDRIASLTPREREVLDRTMACRTTSEVAKDLKVSTKTVEGHRTNLFRRMGVTSLPELALLMAKLVQLTLPGSRARKIGRETDSRR